MPNVKAKSLNKLDFPIAGPGRNDDQVRGLEARCHLVEIGETGAETGDVLTALVEHLDRFHVFREQLPDGMYVVAQSSVPDLVDGLFGLVDRLATSSGSEKPIS